MDLMNDADGLPAEYRDKAPVTLVGAAHIWAKRAKEAEASVAPLRRRLLLWKLAFSALAPPVLVALVLLWMRG